MIYHIYKNYKRFLFEDFFVFLGLLFFLFSLYNQYFFLLLISIIISYILMIFGIEIAAHRFVSHKSFKTNYFFSLFLYFMQILTFFGTSLDWKISHLIHHKFADTKNDPTSKEINSYFSLLTGIWRYHKLDDEIKKIAFKILLKSDKNLKFLHKITTIVQFSFILLLLLIEYYSLIVFLMAIFILRIKIGFLNILGHDEILKSPTSNRLQSIITIGSYDHLYHHNFPNEYKTNDWDLAAFIINKIKI